MRGEPPEFQAYNRLVRDTPKERAWEQIEIAARSLVAHSQTPMTLRDAVIMVVVTRPRMGQEQQRVPS